jgi:maleylacetoacetate isomerase
VTCPWCSKRLYLPEAALAAHPRPLALVADPSSSASLRVLCALRLKEVSLPLRAVRLRAGEQHAPAHRTLNPTRAVPVLLLEGGEVIAQSVAILEYLETCFPEPRLIPADPLQAARVRSLCSLVAADIHPLTNLRVRERVAAQHGAGAGADWTRHWSALALEALEGWMKRWAGRCSVGDQWTLADCFVVPAVFTLQRLGCELTQEGRVAAVYRAALALPAFGGPLAAALQPPA